MPIQHMQHDHPGLKYLEAILIFREWKQSGKAGFTAETFMAYTSCKKLLISSNTSLEVTKNLFEEHQKLFNMPNRGGLVKPSAFCFATTVFAMQFFNALASNAKIMKRLLTLNNPLAVFTNASTAVANASLSCDLTDIKCSSDHTNFKFIVQTVFNQLKKLNSRPTIEDPQEKSLREI